MFRARKKDALKMRSIANVYNMRAYDAAQNALSSGTVMHPDGTMSPVRKRATAEDSSMPVDTTQHPTAQQQHQFGVYNAQPQKW